MVEITAPIVHRTAIRCPKEQAFDMLATAKGYDQWFTNGMILEEKPGGQMQFVWREWGAERVDTEAEARVLVHERPDRFVFQWWLDRPTTVTLTFSDDPEGTLVTVSEVGYENSPEGWGRCLDCATGWGEAFTLVKFYLEHGVTYR
jgi:Activator of Hsp90 ATPase homolog 1-like protein